MENYHTSKTKKGLKVLLVKRPKNPKLVHFQYVLGIGSDLESGRQLEITHFLEHLFVSLTSTKYPDSKSNRELFSINNITYSASIGTKNTVHEYSFRKAKLDLFLDIFINAMVDYKVDKNIFKNEQNSIVEELHEIINDVSYPLETYTDTMIYRGHHRTISQKMRLQNTQKMTPNQIQNFYEKYYRHPYSVLAFYGDLDINTIIKKINQLESSIKTKNDNSKPYNRLSLNHLYIPYKNKAESKLLYIKKYDNISTIKINWRLDINMFDRDYYKIYALDNILLNDLNSLLLKKLRTEMGLIYDIKSTFSIDEFQNNLSFYSFQTTVSSKNVLKVIVSFLEVIDYLTKNKIKEENYRKYIETQTQFALDRNENMDYNTILTNYAKNYLWNHNILTLQNEDKLYVNMSRDNILSVAKKIFTTNNLYISYSNNTNINKKINDILDAQDF